jgi:hypothetical protein
MPEQESTQFAARIAPIPSDFTDQISSTGTFEASGISNIIEEDLASELLLPDLQTLPPTNLRLFRDAESGGIHLRFSNSIWNSGPGKLELIGNPNQARDQILVIQRIYGPDADKFEQHEVGEFVFHDQHNHWHLEQFASYEIWSVDEGGTLETMIATGGKVSYCVMDVSLAENGLTEGVVPQNRSYAHCEDNQQGLSVGWVDTYKYFYPGQSVEVSSLEDGIYALVSTVDPLHLLIEENTHNNSAMVYFEMRDSRLKIVDYLFIEEKGEPNPR